MLIDPLAIEEAAVRIRQWLQPTPLIRSHFLGERTRANVYLKLETLQPTHSFKVRGAFNALGRLTDDQRRLGVVTASGGNHGLALAYASKTLGVPVTVYLPERTSVHRINAIEASGAKVVLHGTAWDESNRRAMETARSSGACYIHPFNNLDVMAGQGTIVSELITQLPRIDLIIASIGGGGLLSGLLSAVRAHGAATRVIGVETEGADCMYQSWLAGRIVELPAITSIAETLGARKTERRQFDIVTRYADALVTVSDREAVTALIALLETEKLLTEPATACSVAALIEGRCAANAGENIVVVLCGANVGIDQVCAWLHQFTE